MRRRDRPRNVAKKRLNASSARKRDRMPPPSPRKCGTFPHERRRTRKIQYVWLGGPGFEPGLTESESACFTVELSPTRWKAKFGRMDVSEARRDQRLEIDHKEIARRNTQLESDIYHYVSN